MIQLFQSLIVGLNLILGIHSTPAQPPKPTPTPAPVQEYTASGVYTFFGQAVSYHLDFPKAGGPVKGSFDGLCSGQINGNYSGGTHGDINGKVEGNCQFLVIKQPVSGIYKGSLSGNTLEVNYEGALGDANNSGSLSLEVH